MTTLHQEFSPPEALQDAVKCFWYHRRDLGEQPSVFDVQPDGYAEIIFHVGGACHVVSNGSLKPLPSPFIMGLLNQPAVFSAQGRFEVLAVRCFPWTVYDLLGLQPDQDGAGLRQHPIVQLQPALAALLQAGRIDAALALLTQHVLQLRAQVALDSMLSKAGTAMAQASGSLPVSQVAAAAHTTVRTLERKFRSSSGHTVKDVSSLMRFEQARNHLWRHPEANIAALAQALGYTDQSHLNREFKRYSGVAPSVFAHKAKNMRPAAGGDFVAFVQA